MRKLSTNIIWDYNSKYLVQLVFIMMINVPTFLNAQNIYSMGTYVGNGTSKTINNIGFQPDVILVKAASSEDGWVATNTMNIGYCKSLDGTNILQTGIISSTNANGFVVGSSAQSNSNGITYHFICFKTGTMLSTGSYTGNGGATKGITGLGFQPEMVWIFSDDNSTNSQAFLGIASNTQRGVRWSDGGYTGTNGIWSYDSDGFTAGSYYNTTSKTYHYVAFNESGTTFREDNYAGSGFDNTNITLASTAFRPDFLLITNSANLGSVNIKFKHNSGDITFPAANAGSTSNLIQSFNADGFQVGNATAVNWAGVSYTYAAFAGGNTLPVKILTFEAEFTAGKGTQLLWLTASEINNDFFTIQRSYDLINFTDVAYVQGKGSTNIIQNYEFLDTLLSSENIVYYRLKQTDYNGESEFLKIINIKPSSETFFNLNVSPNPAEEMVQINIISKHQGFFNFSICTDQGKEIYNKLFEKTEYSTSFSTPVNHLSPGIYIFFIKDSNGNTIGKKVLKM